MVVAQGRDAQQSMAAHKLTVNGRPAEGGTVSLWGARAEFVMRTPGGGPFLVSLFLTSGRKRRGHLHVWLGGREFQSPEISAEGDWTQVLYSYRVDAPRGQDATRFAITANGIYIRRVSISKAMEKEEAVDKLVPSSYRTVLRTREGEAGALVLFSSEPFERACATQLARSLGLPAREEPELEEPLPAWPLKGVEPDTNLILVSAGKGGPLAQAFRRATLILEDERVPGAGGFLIRTVARPFAKSKANVIVISTSEPKALGSACAAFKPAMDKGELVWNRFILERPGPEWEKVRPYWFRLKPDDGYFGKQRRDLSLPNAGQKGSAPERSYIRRTHDYADRYYACGHDGFALLYRDFIFKMEDEGIYGGYDSHMQLYGLMRGWDRVEESPALSEADRLRITRYLLKCVDGPEGYWRAFGGYEAYSGPVKMRHNHQTILCDGLLQAYLYYGRLYELGAAEMWKEWIDEIAADATRWGRAPEDSENYEPLTFKEHARLLRWRGLSTNGQPGTEHWLEAAKRFVCARDSFGLPATYGDCWDQAAVTFLEWFEFLDEDWGWAPAQWTIDRVAHGYRLVNPRHSAARDEFAYLHCSSAAGGPKTVPDPALKAAELRELTGLVVLPVAKGYYDYMIGAVGNESFWKENPKPWAPSHEKAFDKLIYRSGWDPGDEYLLVEGIGWADHGHFDLGSLVHYCAGGRLWIVDAGYNNTGIEHHSNVEVKRDGKEAWGYFEGQKGRWGDFRSGPPMAELVGCKPAKPGTAGPFEVELRVRDAAGAVWTRSIKGGGGRALEVSDRFVAERSGDYEFIWRLRLLGKVEGMGDNWVVRQKGASLPVRLSLGAGESCEPGKWEPDGHAQDGGAFPWYPVGEEPGRPVTLEWKRSVRLGGGQSTEMRAAIGPPVRE